MAIKALNQNTHTAVSALIAPVFRIQPRYSDGRKISSKCTPPCPILPESWVGHRTPETERPYRIQCPSFITPFGKIRGFIGVEAAKS